MLKADQPHITLDLPFQVKAFTFAYEGCPVPVKIVLQDPPTYLFAPTAGTPPSEPDGSLTEPESEQAQVSLTQVSKDAGKSKEGKGKDPLPRVPRLARHVNA
ncbi:hypothetical protein BDN67DRAFT_975093 [Paxillus ammoniavirescens]|nr:hypothetical protein BDN67DRAFT_975093 [Paxillus ammoniavirescens]